MWVLMIVLASCQDVAEETGQIEAVSFEPGYPSLHTVPPRPQLSYTIEQRRTIVDGLIADRANARYSSDVVRYRAGLSSLPPPAVPALAVPLEPEPEAADAADTVTLPVPARDAPVVDPETEFLYEDDDLDSFMEEMIESPGPAEGGPGGEPEANAAPLGTRVIRASAVGPVPRAAAYPGRPPVVTLAMPPETASLPVPVASNGMEHAASSAPAAVETALAGRAPGVVWGMPDLTPPPAEPTPTLTRELRHAALPPSAPVETRLAGRAPGVVWGMPEMAPAPAEPMPAAPETPADGTRHASPPAPAPVETVLAGGAPGVVWGMPDMAEAPAGPSPAASPREISDSTTAAHAAPLPAPANPRTARVETILAGAAAEPVEAHEPRQAAPPAPAPAKPALDASETTIARGTTALAGRPMPQPLPKPVANADRIEVASGLVAIDAASRDQSAAVLGSIPFGFESAMLTPDAVARLGQFLAEAQAREARIKIVGEAAAPALALDRALAVGLALVQSGVPADRLELTRARGGAGDQARLFLAAPAL